MTTAHLTEAQKLAPSALIELFELDTSTCVLSSAPGVHSVGEVYRWCAGNTEQRETGVSTVVAPSQTVITLERNILVDSLATYVFACINPSTGLWTTPSLVASISGATVTLVFALGFVPPAGTEWNLYAQHPVRFNGLSYLPMPIEATGFEWNGQGKLPRPKLRASNVGGLATGLLVAFGDLLGATLTRTRTFARFLDGQPTADPTAYFEQDRFRVDRKAGQTSYEVAFELASELDQIGLRLPRRQMLRNTCGHSYRKRGSGVNRVAYSDYNAAAWVNSFPAGGSLTTGIDDAFGGAAAVRFAGTGTTPALLRVNIPGIVLDGLTPYTISFYARLISAAAGLICDLYDGAPNGNYVPQLVLGAYTRVWVTGTPAAGGKNWVDLITNVTTVGVIDFCGVQLEPGTVPTALKRTNGSVADSAWVYGTCPYAEAGMFTLNNVSTVDPALDVCDHHLTGCTARFGVKAPKPIQAFPGIALVRAG